MQVIPWNKESLKIAEEMRQLRTERDEKIAALKNEYAAKLDALSALVSELSASKPPKPSAADRYVEPDDAPQRFCNGCGAPMLRSTKENAQGLIDRANHGHMWSTLKRMRSDFCCWRCRHNLKGHTVLCVAEGVDESCK